MNPIQETTRTFQQYTTQLLSYIQDFYPDMIPLFSDNAFGQIILELNSAIGMNISTQLNRSLQETRVDESQERRSLYAIAKNQNIRIPNVSPSITMIDFTFDVPTLGDTFAEEYLPIVKAGTQVLGNGQTFEVSEDIDFSSDFSIGGMPNRKIQPILNGNNEVVRYEITKREIVLSGRSEVFRRVVNNSEDFLEIILPSNNVINVEQVIIKTGTNLSEPNNEEFFDEDIRWYEVESLAQNKVFVSDGSSALDGILKGELKDVERKFTYEFTPNGFCKLNFGNGKNTLNNFDLMLSDNYQNEFLNGILNNNSLGLRVPSNSSMYVKYRTGGGETSNVNANTINNVGFTNIVINGSNQTLNNEILRTLRVNNPIPALGGRGKLTNKEIQKYLQFNKLKNYGAVTNSDYLNLLDGLDGRFGKPYRSNVVLVDNKLQVYIIGIDSDSNLVKVGNDTLSNNIKEYLSYNRMFNDYIEVVDGEIINIGLDIELIVPNEVNDGTITNQIYNSVETYLNNYNFRLGGEFNIAELGGLLQNLKTVLAVNKITAYNIVDSSNEQYSSDIASKMTLELQSSLGNITRYKYVDNPQLLVSDGNEIFEIKNVLQDVNIILKKTLF